ncbi:MAG TPA: M99 family metallo-carboxypeptidase C-terminal domain-containing protein [bacterium]|nr:M99 family metallo-carboxypeptidase C-terminal domain-containing protein [bacterium]
MNGDILARLLVLVCVGIAFLALLIGFLVYQINRKKGAIGILLAIVFTIITGYYSYLFFFPTGAVKVTQQGNVQSPRITGTSGPAPLMVAIETEDGNRLTAADGDYLDIKTDMKIKIIGVVQNGNPVENVRVNVIGFAPKDNPQTINDTGYLFSYNDMLKKFAVDDEKITYRVEVKQSDAKLAEIFLRFVK